MPDINQDIIYPLAVTEMFIVLCQDNASDNNAQQYAQIVSHGTIGFRFYEVFVNANKVVPRESQYVNWLALGIII